MNESKQTRLSLAAVALCDVLREYSPGSWAKQLCYVLEILQNIDEQPGYEDALRALRDALDARLTTGHW